MKFTENNRLAAGAILLGISLSLGLTSSFDSVSDIQIPTASVVEIANPEIFSRVLALSDAHGMYPQLLALLSSAQLLDSNSNWAGGKSLVLVVGDSIDKGPQTIEILDLWMKLTSQATLAGGRVIHLLGNHEAEFLADPGNDPKAGAFLAELAQRGMDLSEFTDPDKPHGAFLRAMPIAARVGKWFFSHAGLLPEESFADFIAEASAKLGSGSYGDSFFIGKSSVLEAKGWWADDQLRAQLESRLAQNGLFGVVFGHQPAALGVLGEAAVSNDMKLLKIDSGMAPEAGSHAGALIVFPNPIEMNALEPPQVLEVKSGHFNLTKIAVEKK